MIRPFPNILYKQEKPVYKYGQDPGKRLLIVGLADRPGDDKIFDPPVETVNTFSNEEMVRMFMLDDYNFNQLYFYQPYSINSLTQATRIFGSSSSVYRMTKEIYDLVGPVRVYGMNIYLDNLDLDDENNDIQRLMDTLEHVEFDYILLDSNIRIENQYSLFDEFTNLAHLKERQGSLVHMISLAKINSKSIEDTVFERIQSFQKIYNFEQYETGKYISVVNDQITDYEAHTYYAALLLNQPDAESPVNVQLKEDIVLNNELTLEDEQRYYEAGVVVLKDSFHKGVIFANSTTAVVGTESIHKTFPNFKIVSAFIREIRYKFDPFIGKPIQMFTNLHLMEILGDAENKFIDLEYIRGIDYEFEIDEVLGIVYLTLYIVPIFTIHSIKVTTRIEVTV